MGKIDLAPAGIAARARPVAERRPAWCAALAGLMVTVMMLGLLARILSFPLRHDEQFFVPAGILFSPGGLYPDFGYNQPPNLPILLHSIYALSGTEAYLSVGRLTIFVAWLIAAAAVALVSKQLSGSTAIAVLAVSLLVNNQILLGQAGMAVTNSFIPVPLVLVGTGLFLGATKQEKPAAWRLFASGFAIAAAMGFKANYIFLGPCFAVATLAVPDHLTIRRRIVAVSLPFAAGALIGGLPSLLYLLADPSGFFAHVIGYHRGAQLAFWASNSQLDGPKVMSFAQKVQLAQQLWLSDTAALIPLFMISFALLPRLTGGDGSRHTTSRRRELALLLVLTMFGMVISFVPSPSFPQYFVPPLAFAIMTMAMLHGCLDGRQRAAARPFVLGAILLVVLVGAPPLLRDLPHLAHPARWSGTNLHWQSRQLAAATARIDGPIATLAPLYPLEAGKPIYRELAAGFVLYRVGDHLRQTQGSHYRYLTSPGTVGALLARDPPAAILVGTEGELDRPLTSFALSHGYRASTRQIEDARKGVLTLYLRADEAQPAEPRL